MSKTTATLVGTYWAQRVGVVGICWPAPKDSRRVIERLGFIECSPSDLAGSWNSTYLWTTTKLTGETTGSIKGNFWTQSMAARLE